MGQAKIVQLSDNTKTLPDGSQIIYAENHDSLVLHHKKDEEEKIYIYGRFTGQVTVNGENGSESDKKEMIQLGRYFLNHTNDEELVTLSIQDK